MDSGEHRVHERAMLREVVVRPGHELPADADVVGREVLGPDLRSEEDEVLGGGKALVDDCDLEWGYSAICDSIQVDVPVLQLREDGEKPLGSGIGGRPSM